MMKTIGRPFLIVLLLLLITVVGFVYYYGQASTAIAAARTSIATQGGQIAILQSQVSSMTSQASSLESQLSANKFQLAAAQSQLTQANTQLSSLQKDLDSYKAQVTALQKDAASYKSQVSSLQSDVASYKTQVASLEAKLVAAGSANITDLQNQVSALQAQNLDLADIVNLTKVSVKVDSAGITQTIPTHPYELVTFGAAYAGYVVISGQSTSGDAFITVTDSFPGYPFNDYRYPFGANTVLTVPVLPGSITVAYNSTNQAAVSSATISVRYYY